MMYTFNYDLSKQEYIDFNLYHARNSKLVKKIILIGKIVCPVIVLIGGYYETGYKDILGISIFGVAVLVWVLFFERLYINSMKRRVKKLLDEGKDNSLYNKRSLIIDENRIIEEADNKESYKQWEKIVKVVCSDDNVFIYVTELEGIIIPKKIVGDEDDVAEFIRYVKDKFKVG